MIRNRNWWLIHRSYKYDLLLKMSWYYSLKGYFDPQITFLNTGIRGKKYVLADVTKERDIKTHTHTLSCTLGPKAIDISLQIKTVMQKIVIVKRIALNEGQGDNFLLLNGCTWVCVMLLILVITFSILSSHWWRSSWMISGELPLYTLIPTHIQQSIERERLFLCRWFSKATSHLLPNFLLQSYIVESDWRFTKDLYVFAWRFTPIR